MPRIMGFYAPQQVAAGNDTSLKKGRAGGTGGIKRGKGAVKKSEHG